MTWNECIVCIAIHGSYWCIVSRALSRKAVLYHRYTTIDCSCHDNVDKVGHFFQTGIPFTQITWQHKIEFFEDMEALNILPPSRSTQVTEYVPEIIDFVNEIMDKGYAYTTPSGKIRGRSSSSICSNDLYNATRIISIEQNMACKVNWLELVLLLWQIAKQSSNQKNVYSCKDFIIL